jgi:serine/threonine-protein kinase RsbW
VALARGMLSAVLELLGFGVEVLDDVKMAVSEACNNVVLHAYGDGTGPMFVDVEVSERLLGVVVRDRGVGIAEQPPAEGRLGVGLPMMQSLADRAEVRDAHGGGTEVRLAFSPDSLPAPMPEPDAEPRLGASAAARPGGDVVVSGCPPSMLGAVLGRLATIVAAGVRFSLDRLSDVRLVTDAVADRVQPVSDEPVSFALTTTLRRLELLLGPFQPGTSARLLPERSSLSASSLPWLLADAWEAEPIGDYELMRIVITDPVAPSAAAGRAGH